MTKDVNFPERSANTVPPAPAAPGAPAAFGAQPAPSAQPSAQASFTSACVHCRKCTKRCEVLEDPNQDIGSIEEHYRRLSALPKEQRPAATMAFAQEHPDIYHALRRCCFCGYCTSTCNVSIKAPEHMRVWRELFSECGLMPPDASKLVMVDSEWHIFSAYRAIYNIAYPEYIMLADAAKAATAPGATVAPGQAGGNDGIDTVFFPGCSLVSYAPDLTRKVGSWLSAAGVKWALSSDCCGSPLMSAGLFDRAEALRTKILNQCRTLGIKRVLTVCPGCGEELAATFHNKIEIIPCAEFMLRIAEGTVEGCTFPALSPADLESVVVFDSCHDRTDGRHGTATREMISRYLPAAEQREMDHTRAETLCCGAGGAVSSYDPDISTNRVWRVINEARATGAKTLVTTCPTCTYTIAQACLDAPAERIMENHHYLELLFDEMIPWETVFAQLGDMWTGEYGPWLNYTFF